MSTKILIKYGELTTKGKNRGQFLEKLKFNFEKIHHLQIDANYDFALLDYSEENLFEISKVLGISNYAIAEEIETSLESITECALRIFEDALKNYKNSEQLTFRVETHRNWKLFEQNSNQVDVKVGETIFEKYNTPVDLKNPKLTVHIEIRKEHSYVYIKKTRGWNGYPVGINGRALMLLSGGIDSPVASFELMKRGIKVEFLCFITPPHTDEKTIEKVKNLVTHLSQYQGESRIFLCNFTKIMHTIEFATDQSYRIILMRRSFYRIASMVAKANNFLTLANGENIGQVASQTLESMNVVQSGIPFVILRPLLTANKINTIEYAKKLGTYEISIERTKESCEIFAPKRPVIKPNLKNCLRLEDELGEFFELEKSAFENIEIIKIKH